MKRREFITLLGGAAAAWPLAARAQQPERTMRVGVLTGADGAETDDTLMAFLQALQQFGWTVGRNLQIDTRRGGGDPDRIRRHAAELAALAPNVILAAGP